MSDDDQITGQQVGEQEVTGDPEPSKQEEPMPSSELEIEAELEPEVDGSLPEDASERTREQFEKLKEANRKLNEENETLKRGTQYGDSVYDGFYGRTGMASNPRVDSQGFTPQQVDNAAADFIDAQGNVDIVGLNSFLRETREIAEKANKRTDQVAMETKRTVEQQQVATAHDKYPWLDPKSPNFDPTGYELVRDRMVGYYARGRNPALAEVAKEVTGFYTPKSVAVKTETAQKSTENASKKQQASSVSRGKGQPRAETATVDDLRKATRRGDSNALDERIRLATGS